MSNTRRAKDAPRVPSSFFSLRWKIALAITALLALLMSFLSWYFYQHMNDRFTRQLQQAHQHDERLLDNLVTGTVTHLQHQAKLVVIKSEPASDQVGATHQSLTPIGQQLEKDWPRMAKTLAAAQLYNRQGIVFAEFGDRPASNLLAEWVEMASNTARPLSAIGCARRCYLYSLMPLQERNQRLGVLVLAAATDTLLSGFREAGKIELGILDFSERNFQVLNEPAAEFWRGNLLTLTGGKQNITLLRRAASAHPQLRYFRQPVTFSYLDHHYSISLIPIKGLSVNDMQFVVLSDMSQTHQRMTRRLREDILLSAACLLILALLFVSALSRCIRHINNQAQLLPLLGQKKFQQVRERLHRHREAARFVDELDLLDEATTTLSFQLESQERAIELRDREMERQALFDSLTGLANRHLFQYELDRDVSRFNSQVTDFKIALILLDIDKFKRINDSLGHQQGDLLLRRIANRLKKSTRSLGLSARLSGNEFAILVRNVKTSAHIEILCQKIIQLLSKPIALEQNRVIVSCSVGASLISSQQTAHDLVKHAEIAMYKVKEAGGNGYQLYTAAMASDARHTLSLEAEIHRGFDENEYTLYLQPKVNMESEIEGFEALIRWDHPDRGILPPSEFIPAMEGMGVIAKLDNLILEASCRQLYVWKIHFPEKSLAVNISSTHFTDRNFLVFLQKCLKKYPIDPKKLELEITETLLMENLSAGLDVIKQIKALGVNIAIDDFGTGYSSLSYLKNLPVDTLKIDREFIRDIPDSQSDMQISSAIIFLAKQLGFKVVAEGVETSEQLSFLKARHCDLAQGYYFSKPIPAHKAMVMLESQRLTTK